MFNVGGVLFSNPLAPLTGHLIYKLFTNTSGVLKSSSDWLKYTGFPGDLSVTFFIVPSGNKDAVTPNPPPRKKKAIVFITVTANAYQDKINAAFSKVCEIFKIRSIDSLKYIREFLLLWQHFHATKRDAERNEL